MLKTGQKGGTCYKLDKSEEHFKMKRKEHNTTISKNVTESAQKNRHKKH